MIIALESMQIVLISKKKLIEINRFFRESIKEHVGKISDVFSHQLVYKEQRKPGSCMSKIWMRHFTHVLIMKRVAITLF